MVNPNFSNCVPAAIVNMIVKSTFFVKRGNKFRQIIADTDPAGHKKLSQALRPKLLSLPKTLHTAFCCRTHIPSCHSSG